MLENEKKDEQTAEASPEPASAAPAPTSEQKENTWVVSDAPSKRAQATEAAADKAQPYLYRWSYADQSAFDRKQDQKQKKRGILTYAIIMASVFALCFAILLGTLIWYHIGGDVGRGTDFTAVSEAVSPATVLIYATSEDMVGYGTGFFIQSDGYIATNYHVVEHADTITVTLYNGKTHHATLVGYSRNDDLAVLKIPGSLYPTVSIGNSDSLRVGDAAIVVGNPSGADGAWTTTQGIISALDRPVGVESSIYNGVVIGTIYMIQTDAAVNPGNSGGPLCNSYGEVVGIITKKYIGTNETTFEAMGYALPINDAMPLLNAIIENGSTDGVTSTLFIPRPVLGVTVQDVQSGKTYKAESGASYTAKCDGVMITNVTSGLPAHGHLRVGDVIYGADGQNVTTQSELSAVLYSHKIGDSITLNVMRGKEEIELTFELYKVN